MCEVSSEIYSETDFKPIKCDNGRILSKFSFTFVPDVRKFKIKTDEDGDLIIPRKSHGTIELEHSGSTVLQLVGLQVWRGALLLADFLFYMHEKIADKTILELGAGVGLTSIAAAIYAKKVVCTDVDLGGILDVINANIERNQDLFQNDVIVMELDFKKEFSSKLNKLILDTDIVIAADVIYDNDLTDCFINILDKLLNKNHTKEKTIYIALEKRYVFTLCDLDTVAPCYEYFMSSISKKSWKLNNIPIDFPQYFQYERCKDLILFEIRN